MAKAKAKPKAAKARAKRSASKRPAVERQPAAPDQKQIEAETPDRDDRIARVAQETSSDGRFSSYEVAPKKDPRDGDLILQYRGAPRED